MPISCRDGDICNIGLKSNLQENVIGGLGLLGVHEVGSWGEGRGGVKWGRGTAASGQRQLNNCHLAAHDVMPVIGRGA